MAAKKKITGGPLNAKESNTADASDPAGVKEVMNSLKNRVGSPEQILESWAEVCRTELLKRVPDVDVDPRRVEEGVEQAGFEHPSPEWYCARIINRIHAISGVAHSGDAWTAVRLAFELGQLVKELQNLQFDTPLRTGVKVMEGGKKGGQAKAEQKAGRDQMIKAEYEAGRQKFKLKKQAKAELERRYKISARHVERIVKK